MITNQEKLNELYKRRAEIQKNADRRFAMDIDIPYPSELQEIDEQIKRLEPYIPIIDRLPSQTNYDKIERETALANKERRERRQTEYDQRQLRKQQRILNTKEDKKIHTLNLIEEYAEELHPSNKNFDIDSDEFNYTDHRLLKSFLKRCQEKGCFNDIQFRPMVLRCRINFFGVDIKNIKKFKKQLKKSYNLEEKTPPTFKKIKIIISKELGIYKESDKESGVYSIKSTSNRCSYVWKLKDGKKNAKFLNKNYPLLNKEIKQINKNFKDKLNLKENLVLNLPTGGYTLNHEKFNIEFSEN